MIQKNFYKKLWGVTNYINPINYKVNWEGLDSVSPTRLHWTAIIYIQDPKVVSTQLYQAYPSSNLCEHHARIQTNLQGEIRQIEFL